MCKHLNGLSVSKLFTCTRVLDFENRNLERIQLFFFYLRVSEIGESFVASIYFIQRVIQSMTKVRIISLYIFETN